MPKFNKSNFKVRELKVSPDAKYLVIVESPSKCKKIESYLGRDYACIASIGHLRKIDGLKSIDTKNNHSIVFSLMNDKKAHIKEIEKVMKQFSKENIIIATDDDREGEAIAWHICEIFNLDIQTTKRIIFHEITQSAIQHAIKYPTKINMDLVTSQQARQVVDLYVGYKISPVLCKYLFHNKEQSLSAGRCQTPALRLVYDNHKSYENAPLEFIYKTKATFFPKNIIFQLSKDFSREEEIESFLEDSCDFNYVLSFGNPKESVKGRPKPYNTSRLLQSASSSLNMSPKETMSLCQTLYQEGLITYMRTDSTKYAKPFLDKAVDFIEKRYGNNCIGPKEPIELKDSKDPHEAIRITNLDQSSVKSDNRRLSSLYHLIWKNTLQSIMCDCVCINTEVKITAPQDLYYSHIVEVPKILGWKKIEEKEDLTENQNSGNGLLLYLKTLVTKKLMFNKIESSVNLKQKQLHYCEAGLIKQLEKMGIGRPSTFASLVETIKERNYITKRDVEGMSCNVKEYTLNSSHEMEINELDKTFGGEKNKLVIEPLGVLCVEFLMKYFSDLFSYDYTEQMEMDLDTINETNGKYKEVCDKCNKNILSQMEPIKKLNKESFKIDDTYELVYEKYGPVLRKTQEDGSYQYTSVKRELRLNIDKLKAGEYNLEDLVETQQRHMGEYEDKECILKMGKFGMYLMWGENSINLSNETITIDSMTFENVVEKIKEKQQQNKSSNILRELNEETSIRKGKYGPYIFYKPMNAPKPKFFPLKKFPKHYAYATCDKDELLEWIEKTHLKKV